MCVRSCVCVSILVINYFNNGVCASACVLCCELFSSKKRLARWLESIGLYIKRHISVSCHQPLNRTTNGGSTDIHLAELELSSYCLAFCSSCC